MVDWKYGVYRLEVFTVVAVKEAIVSVGPATIMAIIAAVLATLLWWIASRLALPAWVGMFLFGIGLALVILAGPLIRLP